jgi:hypothetical protein
MDPNQVVTGLLMGAVLIVLGAVPGCFQALVEGVGNSIDLLFSDSPGRFGPAASVGQPRWLALAGAALIVLTLLSTN